MGYDMYRVEEEPDLTQDPPKLKIVEGDDSYFRLNIWGMGRAKVLAGWGISTLSVEDLIKHQWNMEDAGKKIGIEGMEAHMITAALFGIKCYESNENESKKFVKGTENFGSNFNYASSKECEVFADAISKAFDKLDSAIIKPNHDYEYYRKFSEWLYKSPDGIFVG
jgi:hypothetical protein